MSASSKLGFKVLISKYLPMALGLRVPGFISIHLRYARHSFITWLVLFVAPFVFALMGLRIFCEAVLKIDPSDLQLYLASFLVIAALFFWAERQRKFRRIYVILIPAIVIFYGGVELFFGGDHPPGNLIKFGIVSALPAWWLWRRASTKGYQLLTDGADKDYRPGQELFARGEYAAAFEYLEPAAKRGHMKALFLIGQAHEQGLGLTQDKIRAAQFYDRAGRKGYPKANRAFEALVDNMSEAEKEALNVAIDATGLKELF